jgi:hypothetical protein
MFVACDLTLGPSPKGEGGPNADRLAVAPFSFSSVSSAGEPMGVGNHLAARD